MADHPSSYSRPPATGYPAPAAPPPASHPNGYPPAQPFYYTSNHQTPFYPYSHNPRTTLLRRIIAAILVATVLFFTIFFICWLVIRPHRPQFHITSFSLSHFNLSSQKLSATWDARFDVYNPNKKLKISYDQIQSFVLYKSEVLSQTRVPPFKQDIKNLTSIDASFSVLDSYVDDWVVKGINADRSSSTRNVAFNVRIMADVGFKVGGFRARRRLLRVWCDNVPVAFSSASSGNGNLTGAPRKCEVYA